MGADLVASCGDVVETRRRSQTRHVTHMTHMPDVVVMKLLRPAKFLLRSMVSLFDMAKAYLEGSGGRGRQVFRCPTECDSAS